ncbi:Hypothetical_protein [Hexamita inflata]|uniref:Hypothetical_protein n=1 Tax=Hexamita inflata TaxID=28002 RepID=A0AA86QX15_9EUKA|nr:Hypothetical protein HINF_LOCUS52452 [Hexamita inflata]
MNLNKFDGSFSAKHQNGTKTPNFNIKSPNLTNLPKLPQNIIYKQGTLQNASYDEKYLLNLSNNLIQNTIKYNMNVRSGNKDIFKYEERKYNLGQGEFRPKSQMQKQRAESIIEQMQPLKYELFHKANTKNNTISDVRSNVNSKIQLKRSQEEYFKQMNNKIDSALNDIQKMREAKDQINVVNLCDRDKQLFVLK